ncbi:MAG: 2Fe-2S iron-sulfur cluster binding domain-containing protein [Nocardioides sp.]|uniref:2Fe-2S iron-sulfur cluster-binding protein n=1 Tax=Nocardioides sp. TaxID=35761 RepID=UPI0039E49F9A
MEVPRPGGELVVRLPSGTRTVQLLPGETLLVAMRRGGIDHPFSCLSGSCGTCLVDVAPGSVPAAVVQQPAGGERLYDRVYACLAAHAIGHDAAAPELTPSNNHSPESVRTQP